MELKERFLGFCSLVAVFVLIVSAAADTSTSSHGDVIEKLLNRVDRLEARAEDQHREISDLRAQLLTQKKRTSFLEGIVRKMKKTERRGTEKHPSNRIAVAEIPGQEQAYQERKKRTVREGIRQIEVETRVAFSTSLTNHLTHVGVHQAIVFDHVITNVGNAYNPHIGTFIAPVPGTYAISTTITTLLDEAHYNIAVNGNAVSNLYVRGTDSPYESSSQAVILQLKTGDDVTIRCYDLDKGVNGNHYSTFSGFLIYQQDSSAGAIVGK